VEILRVFAAFCFAARKKIRKRLQAGIEALRNIDTCHKNQQKSRKKSDFKVGMSEKER
jgi:hypothetical protein